MPQKLLFDYNTEVKFRNNVINHPTHGFMKWLVIYNDFTECSDNITAIYFDMHNIHHKITSDNLNSCIHPQNLRTLLCAIETITNRQVYVQALLALLDDNCKSVSVSTQTLISNLNKTKVVIRNRKPSLSVSHDSEGKEKLKEVETGNSNNLLLSHNSQGNDIIKEVETGNPNNLSVSNDSEGNEKIKEIETGNSNNQVTQAIPISKIGEIPKNITVVNIKPSQNTNNNANNQGNAENCTNENSEAQGTANFISGLNDVVNSKFQSSLILFDGSSLLLPVSPRDMFHLIEPNIMKYLTKEDKQKLIVQQAFVDWKYSLKPNSDGYMPIHLAALHGDVGLLKRQISVLRARNISIDVIAQGLSPLHIAIMKNNLECTKILLGKEANPFIYGKNHRNSLHFAAMSTSEVFDTVMDALLKLISKKAVCKKLAQSYYVSRKDLLKITDSFGYNAFMLACKHGNLRNMVTLWHYCPRIKDIQMASTGNTALHIVLSDFLTYINRNRPGPKQKAQLQVICNLLRIRSKVTLPNHYGLSFMNLLHKSGSLKLIEFLTDPLKNNKFKHNAFERFWSTINQDDEDDIIKFDSRTESQEALSEEPAGETEVIHWELNRKAIAEEERLKEYRRHLNNSNLVPKVVQKLIYKKLVKVNAKDDEYGDYFKTLVNENPLQRTQSKIYEDNITILDPKEAVSKKRATKRRRDSNVDATGIDIKRAQLSNFTNGFVKINAVLSKAIEPTKLQNCNITIVDAIDNKHSNIINFNDINIKLERNDDFSNINRVSARGTPIEMRKVFVVPKEK